MAYNHLSTHYSNRSLSSRVSASRRAKIRSANNKNSQTENTSSRSRTATNTIKSVNGIKINSGLSKILNKAYKTSQTDKVAASVKNGASALNKSTATLMKSGAKSLFNQKKVVQTDSKTGKKTQSMEYDLDAIAKAVKSYVSDYNTMIDATSKSKVTSVVSNANFIKSITNNEKESLNNIGITVGTDSKLTLDETKLKSAAVKDIKSLFNGSGSYAEKIAQSASRIEAVCTRATGSSTYANTGKYTSYMNSMSKNNWYS